ncbi:hypothetical protein [Polymorphobacter megasporae]|uniref:hypothetical protein n=1 Tax=Glacieibacterium megasporae TaxID=2835787 RepID=UPI001C1E4714|nr:hypothetical protein [Polymorphobacter megasporae]UAJ12610.1 hypothetical protein KTC28_18785 [Polymorphobacter megasporae]
MAIDPDLQSLLDRLAIAGLGALARSAAFGATYEGVDEIDVDPIRRDARSPGRWEQLERASKIVSIKLKRELAVSDRLRELAATLELKAIEITPIRSEEAVPLRPDNLLSLERSDALLALLMAWSDAATELRQGWEISRGD